MEHAENNVERYRLDPEVQKLMTEVFNRMRGGAHVRFPISSTEFADLVAAYNANPTTLTALPILRAYVNNISGTVAMTRPELNKLEKLKTKLRDDNPSSDKITECLLEIISFGYLRLQTNTVQKPDGYSRTEISPLYPEVTQRTVRKSKPTLQDQRNSYCIKQYTPYNFTSTNEDVADKNKPIASNRTATRGIFKL